MPIIHSEHGQLENNISKNIIKAIGLQGHSFFFIAYDAEIIHYAIHAEINKNDSINSAIEIKKYIQQKNANAFENSKIYLLPDFFTLSPIGLFEEKDFDLVLGAVYNKNFDGSIESCKIEFSDSLLLSNISTQDKQIIDIFTTNAKINNTCESWLNKVITTDKDAAYLLFVDNFFIIAVIKNSKLVLFNKFEYSDKNDFLYYSLGAVISTNLHNEDINAYICGDILDDSPIITQMKAYFKNVEYSVSNTFNSNDSNSISHHFYPFINF